MPRRSNANDNPGAPVAAGVRYERPSGRAGWRRYMIVDAAVLVINNQQRGAFPEVGVLVNGIVNGRDEELPRLHIVIGMLVGGELLPAVVAFVIGIVRLDETVLRAGRLFWQSPETDRKCRKSAAGSVNRLTTSMVELPCRSNRASWCCRRSEGVRRCSGICSIV